MPTFERELRLVRVSVLVLGLLVLGCEEQPSKLDNLSTDNSVAFAEATDWVAIEERALPMSIRNDLLRTAIGFPDRGTVGERAAALVAWMDAGGSVPVATSAAALNSPAFEFSPPRIVELVKAGPDDDRLFEAALYAGWKMRSDGVGFLAAALATHLTKQLIALREIPPSFAAKYAPTDEHVMRLFASEAMFARHATFEVQAYDDPKTAADLAMWRELAKAPNTREAFIAFVRRTVDAHPKSRIAPVVRSYVERSFTAVDDYQSWLGRKPAPR